jgi:hypothetical protein
LATLTGREAELHGISAKAVDIVRSRAPIAFRATQAIISHGKLKR